MSRYQRLLLILNPAQRYSPASICWNTTRGPGISPLPRIDKGQVQTISQP